MRWLTVRTNDGADPISSADIADFTFLGEPFRLVGAQQGIWKPASFAAAFSIRTKYTRPGQTPPYEDTVGPDGLLRYKWRGTDAGHFENRALREAMRRQVPLIWFYGVGRATYQAVFPVFLLWEEPDRHQFVIDPDVAKGLVSAASPVEEQLRRYILRETKQRLHQPVFRSTVLRAYRQRCAVCSLNHPELLDAAHIIADRKEAGIASVRNGLALCKIHHAAFDKRILGIAPNLIVEIRQDILDEVDGPMLRHGLQGRHGERLMAMPASRTEWPDPTLLESAYERFRAS
jgi:putative restriction endonuclease